MAQRLVPASFTASEPDLSILDGPLFMRILEAADLLGRVTHDFPAISQENPLVTLVGEENSFYDWELDEWNKSVRGISTFVLRSMLSDEYTTAYIGIVDDGEPRLTHKLVVHDDFSDNGILTVINATPQWLMHE